MKLMVLESQIEIFVTNFLFDDQFFMLNRTSDLSQMLVKTKKHIMYLMIYLFVKLTLILHMTITIVERYVFCYEFCKKD